MAKKKKEKFVDDGRTIASMNVDGMPWYTPGGATKDRSPLGELQTKAKNGLPESEPIKLTAKENWAMMRGVLGAALFAAVIFIGVFTLFILFCVYVWFA